ncbi:isocitrate lyase/phosphoenolpyruvate mutase family protein [Acinetobacter sp. NIPH1876]|uniref:isocitrate lyase/PEP mutase family protein n=1 Tax=unclassified Acinetobacter TaxID=196816 RepID=UPI001FADBEF9|nr:isocitrate lyase/phosphoenolpyruvate mutase family protein [Acinetobacter sp. NIPH1876]MCJ0829482.1 isocitrate lyase/phosphoenolpyruvate mutase family protein [Acinetobacter sp. NIPH1876]
MEATIAEKRKIFRDLHQAGCFVLPNPWDAGSAKMLQQLGYQALATTSAGYAWSCGKTDGQLSRAEVLAHLGYMVQSTDQPVNADFESGFAETIEGVVESVTMAIATGVAGISIEDSAGNTEKPLRELEEAVNRIAAARKAIDESGEDVMLIGRAENFFIGVPDLDDTITRLKAYSAAGADCLYAPGIKTADQIVAVVQAVAPKPVNVLIAWDSELSVQELAFLGVRRISVGSALARTTWHAFIQAATSIAETGHFNCFSENISGAELNKRLR